MRKLIWILAVTMLAIAAPARAQTGTQHGVTVKWADTTAGVTFNVYRCAGSCTAMTPSNSTQIATGVTITSYLDPASDTALIAGNSFSYCTTAVLSGEESVCSGVATVTVPSAGFPTSPASPTDETVGVQ